MPKKVEGMLATEATSTSMEPHLTLDLSPEYSKTAPTNIKIPQNAPMTNKAMASADGTLPRPNELYSNPGPSSESRANHELMVIKAATRIMEPPISEKTKAEVGLDAMEGFVRPSAIKGEAG